MKLTDKETQDIAKTIRLRIAISHLATAVMELHTAYGPTSDEYKRANDRIHAVIGELEYDAIEF